jgi:hypothetical protein
MPETRTKLYEVPDNKIEYFYTKDIIVGCSRCFHISRICGAIEFWFGMGGNSLYWFCKSKLISRNLTGATNGTGTHMQSITGVRRVWRYQREVIRIRISKKNRQHNGQKKKYKRTNNDLQSKHIKLEIE